MANLLDTNGVNPIVLTDTGSTSYIAHPMNVNAIVWDSGALGAVGDVLILKDKSGGVNIFSATLAVVKDVLRFDLHGTRINSLYLDTMTHTGGTVYIYVR